jgi:hypothetical protein
MTSPEAKQAVPGVPLLSPRFGRVADTFENKLGNKGLTMQPTQGHRHAWAVHGKYHGAARYALFRALTPDVCMS